MRCPVALLLLLLAPAAFAQTPQALDEAFFRSERRQVLRVITERARAMKPDETNYLPEYARGYLGALEKAKAEEVLRLAEKKEPKDGEVLRLIGFAWLKGGYKSEALSAYELILQRDPKNKEALLQSAIDLAEVGQVTDAEKFMRAYEARENEDWKAFTRFGRAYLLGGYRKHAAPWFAKAVALRPKDEDVLMEILRAFADTQAVL